VLHARYLGGHKCSSYLIELTGRPSREGVLNSAWISRSVVKLNVWKALDIPERHGMHGNDYRRDT
jgi:hypothetical protein